jgi:Winged helix DNA-binding domain
MRRHGLLDRAGGDPLETVARIGGLHAQLMSSAELTLWARHDGLRRELVADALWNDRTLVKLWAMRGTLHLLPTSELSLWLAALGTYEHYLKPVWLRAFGVERSELEGLIAAIGEALNGDQLTREELAAAVQKADPRHAERVRGSWGPFLKPASFRGLLCFAPSEGQKVRFTSPARWVGDALRAVDPEDALEEVTRRYLGAFAPATREQLGRWWAVSPAQAGRMLAALGDEAADAASLRPRNVARLLPAFDQWVIGASRDHPSQLEPEHKGRVHRPQGWISPVLLVNGSIQGVWSHERKGDRLLVEVEPFGRPPAWVRKQVAAEAARLAGFLGGELELSWK